MLLSSKTFLTVDSFVALLLAVSAMLAVFWSWQRCSEEQENVQITQARLQTVARELAKYKKRPDLPELAEKGHIRLEFLKDAWGNSLKLDEKEDAVYSLGSDGLKGGHGFAADLLCRIGD